MDCVFTYRCEGLNEVGGDCGFVEPRTCIWDRPHKVKMRTIGCGLFRKRIPARSALSTLRGYFEERRNQYAVARDHGPSSNKPLTSTSSNTVSTNRSNSELRHPTITPGDEDRGRSYGQNTRNSPSLMSILSSFSGLLERASAAQLFSRGDTEIHVARVLT